MLCFVYCFDGFFVEWDDVIGVILVVICVCEFFEKVCDVMWFVVFGCLECDLWEVGEYVE